MKWEGFGRERSNRKIDFKLEKKGLKKQKRMEERVYDYSTGGSMNPSNSFFSVSQTKLYHL